MKRPHYLLGCIFWTDQGRVDHVLGSLFYDEDMACIPHFIQNWLRLVKAWYRASNSSQLSIILCNQQLGLGQTNVVKSIYFLHQYLVGATSLVLTSVKEGKHVIVPTTLNFVVRRGKLRIYTVLNPPEIFWKFAPSGGYKECAVGFV